jgi:hypothetical protein
MLRKTGSLIGRGGGDDGIPVAHDILIPSRPCCAQWYFLPLPGPHCTVVLPTQSFASTAQWYRLLLNSFPPPCTVVLSSIAQWYCLPNPLPPLSNAQWYCLPLNPLPSLAQQLYCLPLNPLPPLHCGIAYPSIRCPPAQWYWLPLNPMPPLHSGIAYPSIPCSHALCYCLTLNPLSQLHSGIAYPRTTYPYCLYARIVF